MNSAARLVAGRAPGVAWPIDGAHQRWSEASIKSTGPRSCEGSRLQSECVELGSTRSEFPRMSFFPTHDNRCGMSALTWTNPAESWGKLNMTRDLWDEQSHAAKRLCGPCPIGL